MSKVIKQMQMDALKQTFGEVRDLVLLSISGVPALAENGMRLKLRKQNIRLHTVKNSLAARVFTDLGFPGLESHFVGTTTVAWGSSSIADLCKQIDNWSKTEKKVLPRIAVADGAVVPFEAAKKFPTREEALGRIATMVLSPASRIATLLKAPGATLVGQIKSIGDKEGEEAPAAV
jgi:large subunit ribosomal protein L10